MVDILDEIKEELKEEKWLAFWKKYQNHIYGALLTVVVLTAGNTWWQRHQRSKRLEDSSKYIGALRMLGQKDLKLALSIMEEIPLNNSSSYKDMSRFMAASILQDQGDESGAQEVYRSIVNDTSIGPVYRDLALLRLAYLAFDSEDPQALLKSLKPLTDKKNPWRFSALELKALLHAKLMQTQKARGALNTLIMGAEKMAKDQKSAAPKYLLFRAKSLLRSLEKQKPAQEKKAKAVKHKAVKKKGDK